MKRTYTAPTVRAVALVTENAMLTGSTDIQINKDATPQDGESSFSNKRGSSIWSDMED